MSFLDKFRKNKKPEHNLPPVPDWKPEIVQPLNVVIETINYYADGKKDFVVFKHGTISLIPDSLDDEAAAQLAKQSLHNVFHAHPDMRPMQMDDGNILVEYNHDVVNIVLKNIVDKYWETIDKNHQRALATFEAFATPLGHNVFDDFGKKALFGRCYMFMDAQNPKVVEIVRKSA